MMSSLYRWLLLTVFLLLPDLLLAEPYLAVREGLKCSACHSNPTGGGKRNTAGRFYGQTTLPRKPASAPSNQRLNNYVDIGGNFRFSLSGFEQSGPGDTLSLDTDRANVYLETSLIKQQLTLYLDQQFAPASSNREAWLLYRPESSPWYLKAGKLFLPFGIRLEDDTSFVRSTSGISFLTPDNGIEIGLESNRWSAQLALSNGTAGGGENNQGKQFNLRAEYITRPWRAGTSLGSNDGQDDIDRLMYSVFAGLNLWNSEILTEIDWIRDSNIIAGGNDREQIAVLFEINRQILPGNNLKLSVEYLDPDLDVSEDQRNRVSLVWESTPLPLLQLRVGTRQADGIPQSILHNADFYFVQLHAFY